MADIVRPIEPFELTQGFGENPANYVKFGLKGHNGWDLRTKFADTPLGHRNILASWLMQFYRRGVDPAGYGNFFETVVTLNNTYKLTYAHCLSIEDFSVKKEGETMAISDSTGNSTGSHLHLTVKKIKIINGQHEVQDYNNGYFGAINPQIFFDELRKVKGSNSTPVLPKENIEMTVDDQTFTHLVEGATIRKSLAQYIKDSGGTGFDDPDNTPLEAFKSYISGLKSRITSLDSLIKEKDSTIAQLNTEVANQKDKLANKMESCQREKDALEAQIEALKKATNTNTDVVNELTGQVSTLEGKLREAQKAIGERDIEIAKLKSEGGTDNQLLDAIANFISKLLPKINQWK